MMMNAMGGLTLHTAATLPPNTLHVDSLTLSAFCVLTCQHRLLTCCVVLGFFGVNGHSTALAVVTVRN
jgi:hypothetical protein